MRKFKAIFQSFNNPCEGRELPDDWIFPETSMEIEADTKEEAIRIAKSNEIDANSGGRVFLRIVEIR